SIAYLLNNIVYIFMNQDDFNKATVYYNRSLKIFEELGDKQGIAANMGNIGHIYITQSNLDSNSDTISAKLKKAFWYFNNSLKIQEELCNKEGIALSLNNIGRIYFSQSKSSSVPDSSVAKLKKAFEYFNRSLIISEEIGNKQGIATTLNNICEIYYVEEKILKAKEFAERSFIIANELGYPENIMDASLLLNKIYRKKGNYKKSLEYYILYTEMRDSIAKKENIRTIYQLEAKNDYEKKSMADSIVHTKAIHFKEMELVKKEEENKTQSIIIWFFVVGFVIILLFSIMLYRMFLQKKNANFLLAQQKEKIQTQANLLYEKNTELEKLSIVASETDNSVVITDAYGNMKWVNDGFIRLFGYTMDEFINVRGINILEASDNPDIKDKINECIEQKRSVVYSTLTSTKSGKSIWIQTTLTPIISSEGNITKLVAIDSDITKIKEAEEEIKNKNIKIIDSINYAKLIQDAILPSEKYIKSHLPDSFVFFKPRDIVSGDFYWFSEVESKLVIAIADCTGHGVPGAFMSMIGNMLLNEIVINGKITAPAIILEKLDSEIKSSLHKQEGNNFDVMAISICTIDKQQGAIEIAAANHQTIVIQNGELIPVNGEMLSIGDPMSSLLPDYKYKNHCFEISKGNTNIYMFSDGIIDQFGGDKGSKFMYLQFEDLIKEISTFPAKEQLKAIEKRLEQWMNPDESMKFNQLDDIIVAGIMI
ncbi:MAG: SpoIIE family protein phosphatase, partial [Bacteroidota bacterium]